MEKRRPVLCALAGAIGLAFAVGCSSTSPNPGSVLPMSQQAVAVASVGAPLPTRTLPPLVIVNPGSVNGAPHRFSPRRGDTASGGNSQPVDGITCDPTMVENQFHIHSYVGLLVNGGWIAIPDSIGIVGYGPLVHGYVNTGKCFYHIHTHDASGMIHQEVASNTPPSGSLFILQNALDIWGRTLTANSFAQYSGLVRVFTAKPVPLGNQYVSGYTEFTGDPNTLSLTSHEVIWIEVGPPYVEAANLPTVRFYTEY